MLLLVNSIIGAGIFGLPQKLFALTGVYSLAAFVVCALMVLLFVLCFAEVSSRFDATGGPYLYVRTAFGPTAAFVTGWLLLWSRIFNYATLINLLVTYAVSFFAGAEAPLWRAAIITVITLALAWVNYSGIKNTTWVSSTLTIAKLLPLLLFIIGGLFFLDAKAFQPQGVPTFSRFSEAVLLLVFAFGGFESVLVTGGEIQAPRKALPQALMWATAVVAFVYIGVQIVCIGTLPQLGTAQKPVADAAALMVGPTGALLISLGVLISITGTLNVLLLSGSRLPYAFAEQGQLPAVFTRLHPVHRTPGVSLAVVTVLTIIVSIGWSFITALTIGAIIRVLVYAAVCATLIRLRQQQHNHTPFFKLRYGVLFAVVGLLLAVWMLGAATTKELRDVSICVALGLLLYILVGKKNA